MRVERETALLGPRLEGFVQGIGVGGPRQLIDEGHAPILPGLGRDGESAVRVKITNATLGRRRGIRGPGQLHSGTRGMGRATAMMGPAHSLSGAAAWLSVRAATAATGHSMPWPVLLAGALICAGAALAPDLDKAATISRAFGPVS